MPVEKCTKNGKSGYKSSRELLTLLEKVENDVKKDVLFVAYRRNIEIHKKAIKALRKRKLGGGPIYTLQDHLRELKVHLDYQVYKKTQIKFQLMKKDLKWNMAIKASQSRRGDTNIKPVRSQG